MMHQGSERVQVINHREKIHYNNCQIGIDAQVRSIIISILSATIDILIRMPLFIQYHYSYLTTPHSEVNPSVKNTKFKKFQITFFNFNSKLSSLNFGVVPLPNLCNLAIPKVSSPHYAYSTKHGPQQARHQGKGLTKAHEGKGLLRERTWRSGKIFGIFNHGQG